MPDRLRPLYEIDGGDVKADDEADDLEDVEPSGMQTKDVSDDETADVSGEPEEWDWIQPKKER